jgi:hypothetical protein
MLTDQLQYSMDTKPAAAVAGLGSADDGELLPTVCENAAPLLLNTGDLTKTRCVSRLARV